MVQNFSKYVTKVDGTKKPDKRNKKGHLFKLKFKMKMIHRWQTGYCKNDVSPLKKKCVNDQNTKLKKKQKQNTAKIWSNLNYQISLLMA